MTPTEIITEIRKLTQQRNMLLAAAERILSAIDSGRGYDGDVNLSSEDERALRDAVQVAKEEWHNA